MKKTIVVVAFLLAIILAPLSASAAVAVDSMGSNTGPAGAEAATGSFSFTNTAGTLLYVCASGFRNRTVSSITYASVQLTPVRRQATGADFYTECWRLVGPATGSNTVAWTLSGTDAPTFGLISFTGNDPIIPEGMTAGNNTTSTSVSTTITTSRPNSYLFDASYINAANTRTKGASQTQIWNVNDARFGTEGSVGSYQSTTGTGPYTMSWTLSTSVAWTQVVIEVRALPIIGTKVLFNGTQTLINGASVVIP